jgi:hypothetical protein
MMRPTFPLLFVVVCAALTSCGGGKAGSTTGTSGTPDGGTPAPPPTTCTLPEMLADVSKPTAVVGNGSAASCTESALAAALAGGGTVTFDCGAAPVTITVTSELGVTTDTVVDGGNLVTLSGGQKTRIMHLASAWNLATPKLVVQNLTFTEGYTSDVPDTTSTSEGGAAIFEDGGSLTVIGCTFTHNQCASSGQDVSGGAINGQGVGTLIVENSVFSDNSGSNGGAVGTQDEEVTIVNTTFSDNEATGSGGNPGNGGDGGALSYDGANVSLTFCGDQFLGNHAAAQGGAIFRVAYNDELTKVDRSTFDGNSADAMVGLAGAVYLEYTDIEMTGTTISGNSSHYGGGIWIGHAAIGNLTNVTIANNVADQGGGVWIAGQVTGLFLNVTLAGNTTTPGGYAPGLFGGSTAVVLENTIVSGGGCKDDPIGGMGNNLQFPDTGAPCTTGSSIAADPLLGPLQDNGGPTMTMLPGAGSPAIGKGTGCPPTDQRGDPRGATCTLGAVEVQ